MKKLNAILLLMVVMLASCEDGNFPAECSGTIFCTEQFEIFTYDVVDSEDNPLILDSFRSENLDNGEVYDFSDLRDTNSNNTYVVITDAERKELIKDGTTIRFIGEKDGQVVVQEDFVIGHDCCHIVPMEGPGTN